MSKPYRQQHELNKNCNFALLCRRARVYLLAGAWQSAYDLIQEHFPHYLTNEIQSSEVIECLCLQIIASAQLGHTSHVARACAQLSRMLDHKIILSSECHLLSAYCFSIHDSNEGNYRDAQRRIHKALNLIDGSVTSWTRARIEIILSRISCRTGDLHTAEDHALEASHLANVIESEAVRGDAYSLLAQVAKTRGILDEAEVLYANAASPNNS